MLEGSPIRVFVLRLCVWALVLVYMVFVVGYFVGFDFIRLCLIVYGWFVCFKLWVCFVSCDRLLV